MALSYVDWLKKSGRRSSKTNAAQWAKWAGMPAPRGGGRRPAPPPRTRGPGAPTPAYSGYAGAVDPSYGGTPLSTPADAGLVWTGKGNPDLAEIGRGGYGQLTPKKRPDGGWDVYGVPNDPTPQWGKDYLHDLGARETRHEGFADTTLAPWLTNVLGSAQNVNQQTQVDLANRMAQVNQMSANAVPGGSVPLGMTGAGSGQGVGEDVAGANAAGMDARAGIGGGIYNAALNNLTAGTSADAQRSAYAQQRLLLPGKYEQMRMDFTKELGQITEQIRENQRQREFQRQSALEQRREFGMTFSEQVRSAKAGEDIQRGALDIQRDESKWNQDPTNPANAPDQGNNTQQRSLEQIRQGLNKGERVIDGPNNNGFPSEAAGRRATHNNHNVSWERAEDGKFYGVFSPPGTASSGSGGSGADDKDYSKRLREYPFDDYIHGKYKDPKNPGEAPLKVQGAKTAQWIVDDMMGRQNFRPGDAWKLAWNSWIKKMDGGPLFDQHGRFRSGRKYDVSKLFIQRFWKDMPGTNAHKLKNLGSLTGWNDDQLKFIITNGQSDKIRWMG